MLLIFRCFFGDHYCKHSVNLKSGGTFSVQRSATACCVLVNVAASIMQHAVLYFKRQKSLMLPVYITSWTCMQFLGCMRIQDAM